MKQEELKAYALTISDEKAISAMNLGKTIKGFYLTIGRLDFFFASEKKNKTESLAGEILRKLLLPDNPDTRKEILYYLAKGECKKLGKTNFYSIKYNNGACGYSTDELLTISL